MLALEEYDLSDKQCKARYGALRSTASSYKGELTGSDKHLSFFGGKAECGAHSCV